MRHLDIFSGTFVSENDKLNFYPNHLEVPSFKIRVTTNWIPMLSRDKTPNDQLKIWLSIQNRNNLNDLFTLIELLICIFKIIFNFFCILHILSGIYGFLHYCVHFQLR